MNNPVALLIILTTGFTLLSHDAHALHGRADQRASSTLTPHHREVTNVVDPTLILADHGFLEAGAQVCSIDQPAALQGAPGTPAPVAALPGSCCAAKLSLSSALSAFEEPGFPPAVRRAFLQVYLN